MGVQRHFLQYNQAHHVVKFIDAGNRSARGKTPAKRQITDRLEHITFCIQYIQQWKGIDFPNLNLLEIGMKVK